MPLFPLRSFRKETSALALTLILSAAFLFFFYGSNIIHCSKPLASTEDAVKNYYTIQYHVLYDESYMHFSGMNYPYGEHVVFTDCQPAIANTLKAIHSFWHFTPVQIIAILNLMMLLSVIACSLLICQLLLEFNVAWWYAPLAAVGIAFLSPQLMRFNGHYALSYSAIIPLLMLFWVRFFKRPSYTLSFIIALSIFIFSFIHFYYLALLMFMGACFWIFYAFSRRKDWKYLFNNFAFQFILPYLAIQLIMVVTDPVKDRPGHPYGFHEYIAFFDSVFLPAKTAISEFISSHISHIRIGNIESRSYIGFAAGIIFLSLLLRFLWLAARGQWARIRPLYGQPLLNVFFWVALIILLFSFGLPFVGPLYKLPEHLGPLRQFRSIGRFAWIPFYLINTLAFAVLYHFGMQQKQALLKYLIPILGVALLYTDNLDANRVHPELHNSDRFAFLSKTGIDPSAYQAIIAFPYFHLGSENLSLASYCESFDIAQSLSIATGLPMLPQNMSRSSQSQTEKSIALVMEEYRPLSIIRDFKSGKPLLLAVASGCDSLRPEEKKLISRASFIKQAGNVLLYSLDYRVLKNTGKDIRPDISHCTSDSSEVVYRPFDSRSEKYYIAGGLQSQTDDSLVIYKGAFPKNIADSCQMLAWIYVGEDPLANSRLRITEKRTNGTAEGVLFDFCNDHIVALDSSWALLSLTFPRLAQTTGLTITLSNKYMHDQRLYVDELLLKTPSIHYCFRIPGYNVVDDRFYPGKNNLFK